MIFLITILVVPLLALFAGLAVDLGALGVLKDRVQVAVDAGATAAASSIRFVKTDPTCLVNCTGSWTVNPEIARTWARENGLDPVDVTFNPAVPKVTVSGSASVSTSFLRLAGIAQLSTSAVAAAVRGNVSQADMDAEPPTPGHSRLVQ